MYSQISFGKFALGALIASAPLFAGSEDAEWKWFYVAIILLGFAVWQRRGLSQAAKFISGTLKGR